ncbi:LLM class flavin-dependent oxidoreductase [Miltoncostaea marina]|uniref:LLM class flavin-dependent oxidoreductase n=1 Tax=Miltoncostaea marina TaxID=2843215 RepID=UPI001C3C9431|nr:LLM class flavin-dependent oxidoreductase [Miltoncostaea marina]
MGDYGHGIEFGVFVTPSAADAARVVALAELADAVGLDLVTFQDHPYQSRFLDTWTLLSFAAARTERVRLSANVLNLPLRPPAVVARAVASLDILSGGRAELGLGAGAFWDAIAAMGGPRRRPGESVDALEEAIRVIRALWDTGERRGARVEGAHYRLDGAARGPAPVHDVGIWLGAYKPRMLELVGRAADGWLPSLPYMQPGDLAAGNARIDRAAVAAGRDPAAIRRLLNVGPDATPEDLARMALEDGVGTFILMADDEGAVRRLAGEVAPAVRELVAEGRAGGGAGDAREGDGAPAPTRSATGRGAPSPGPGGEYERLGVTPTPDDGTRVGSVAPWDESTRPRREPSPPDVRYTRRGRLVGQHLIDVHDTLRRELDELRDILRQVREGAVGAGEARSALNEMALRQNDWTLGAFCARYCGVVAQHHGLEDDAIFPHLVRSEPGLAPVIDRLADEHHVIHDAIQAVDAALVHHMGDPGDFSRIQSAIDLLTDALLSHLSYEEREIVEPLARHGFYPGQIRDA